jgi:hypothetical protein
MTQGMTVRATPACSAPQLTVPNWPLLTSVKVTGRVNLSWVTEENPGREELIPAGEERGPLTAAT